MTSVLKRPITVSARALSWLSPTLPTEGRMPTSAMRSVAANLGCTAETLRQWVRKSERDRGERGVLTSEDRARLKALGRENRELREANEILRKASA
jgi:transposase-like protein